MKCLKITATDGTSVVIPGSNVLSVSVSAAKKITSVSYLNTSGAATTAAVSAWNGTNTKYELGCMAPDYIFSAYVSN